MQALKNKVVLITGASAGIGAGTALYFAKLGSKLSLTGRIKENLEKTVKECREAGLDEEKIFYTTGDISNRDDRKSIIDKTIEHFGCLDVLVNNAGVASYVPMQEVTEKEYDRLMDTNMKAMFFFSQLAVPHLIKTKGNIVNVSSIAGPNVITSMLLYSITKAAVDSYTKALALELGPHGIRVNAVNPGTIITEVFKRVKNPTDEEFAQFLETQKSKHPLGRVGTPEDVAEVIAFLASDHARFVTGDLVFVDGGRNALGVNAIFKT